MSSPEAKHYFNKIPAQWDSLYAHENSLKYYFNLLFRRDLFRRYELTFMHAGEIQGASVLDIGCGTGRYAIEFARLGAAKVVGIDFAPSMIEFCTSIANQFGFRDTCQFICDDFLKYRFTENFDIVVAMGFFDYIEEPGPFVARIRELTNRVFMASFPTYSFLWSLQRHFRYMARNCPIYDYSNESLQSLLEKNRFDYQISSLTHGLFGIANPR
jgi:2-polyprenyl-3-methyl-5-hydroxy-6-metoxy-1,4-benzoquinol methylase